MSGKAASANSQADVLAQDTALATAAGYSTSDPASAHRLLVQLGIELAAAVVLVMLAGTSQRGANISLTIVVMLWILWSINHYGNG